MQKVKNSGAIYKCISLNQTLNYHKLESIKASHQKPTQNTHSLIDVGTRVEQNANAKNPFPVFKLEYFAIIQCILPAVTGYGLLWHSA